MNYFNKESLYFQCFLDNDRKEKALEYLNKFVIFIPSNPTLMALKAYVQSSDTLFHNFRKKLI